MNRWEYLYIFSLIKNYESLNFKKEQKIFNNNYLKFPNGFVQDSSKTSHFPK